MKVWFDSEAYPRIVGSERGAACLNEGRMDEGMAVRWDSSLEAGLRSLEAAIAGAEGDEN